MSKIVKLHTPAGSVRLVKRRKAVPGEGVKIGDDQARGAAQHEMPPVEPDSEKPALPPLQSEAEILEQHLKAEFKAGFDEGRRHTERNLRASLAAELESERKRIDMLTAGIASAFDELRNAVERDAVRLAIAIAERIVKREIQLDEQVVLRQIHESIRRIVGVEKIKLRVHPADEELVRSMRTSIISSSDAVREIAIEQDESIAPGGCILESESGNVDASIATQLERIENALFADAQEERI